MFRYIFKDIYYIFFKSYHITLLKFNDNIIDYFISIIGKNLIDILIYIL